MIVGSCFDGDVDMALAGVQHDLYFACPAWRPWITIGGGSTLGWIWVNAVHRCAIRRNSIPWIDRNLDRIERIDGFSHKLLQVPHGHMAAYFRWIMPRNERAGVITEIQDEYPMDLLESWKSFLQKDIPEVLSSDDALVALAKSIVYQLFDAGDDAYHDFQDILMRRYGYECVAQTGWAEEVRDRSRATPGITVPTTTNQRGANA
jgi:hypothetical protein